MAKFFPGLEDIDEEKPKRNVASDLDAPSPFFAGLEDVPLPPKPTALEHVKAAGGQAVSGAIESLPFVGAGAGAVLGGVGGGPPGGVVGGTALGIAGLKARDALRDWTDIPTPEELPEDLRPAAYAGQVLGGAAAVGGAPFALARSAPVVGGRFINTIRQAPIKAAIGETMSAIGAGVGEAISEKAAPGVTPMRVAAGIVGGIAPTTWVPLLGVFARSMYDRGRALLSKDPAAMDQRVVNALSDAAAEGGKDTGQLADSIEMAQKAGGPRGATPAQLTGDPTLTSIETELAKRNGRFGTDIAKQGQDALEMLRKNADDLAASGDPAILQEAARAREGYFKGLITNIVRDAETQGAEMAQRLGARSDASPTALSTRAGEIIDDALGMARRVERSMYAKVPDGPKSATVIVDEIDRIKAQDLLPEQRLPPIVEAFYQRMTKAAEDTTQSTGILDASGTPITRTIEGVDDPTTIRELTKFRTLMLDSARDFNPNTNPADRRIFGRLAEAALDDLGMDAADGSPLGDARAFSRQLNDLFTRSFAGDTVATQGGTGGRRLPPETLMRRAVASGNELAVMRITELQKAVQFSAQAAKSLDTEAAGASTAAAAELLAIQDTFMRRAAEGVLDPRTGEVSLRKLATFRRRYAEVLDMFPDLKRQLGDAGTAQETLQGARVTADGATQRIRQDAAFARVAKAENPVQAVGSALSGMQPAEDMRQLAILARRDGQDATRGLQSAVLEDAMQTASSADGFSWLRYKKALFAPRRAGGPSAIDMLKRTGVMDWQTAENLRKLIDQAGTVETAMKGGPGVPSLLATDNAMGLFAERSLGASVGTAAGKLLPGGGGGHQLIHAAAGSKMMQALINKIPAGKAQELLLIAARDPELMKALLRKARTGQEAIRLGMTIHGGMLAAGLLEVDPPQNAPDE